MYQHVPDGIPVKLHQSPQSWDASAGFMMRACPASVSVVANALSPETEFQPVQWSVDCVATMASIMA